MHVGGPVFRGLEDDRVDEADERGVRDAVVGLVVVGLLLLERRLLLEHRTSAERLRGAAEAADLRQDVVARGDAEVDRVAGRELQLVDRIDVAGVGDRDAERPVVELVRDRDQTLEHVQGHEPRRLGVDAGQRQVDERHVEAGREHARDALGGGIPLVDDRLRERAALPGRAAQDVELVLGEQCRRGQEVGDELRRRVHGSERRRRPAAVGSFLARLAGGAQGRMLRIHGSNPSIEVSAQGAEMLSRISGESDDP